MKVNIGKFKKNGKERTVKVQIDNYDTWSLDHTLALIILPALKQYKEDTNGHPCGLAPDPTQTRVDGCGNCGCEQKWNEILDKMIWSFEQVVDDDIVGYTPEEYKKYNERVQEGLELFGKHYRALWT